MLYKLRLQSKGKTRYSPIPFLMIGNYPNKKQAKENFALTEEQINQWLRAKTLIEIEQGGRK
jgi:hypothetical protein